jgi:Ni,Fe-hydrogenase I small subunit
VEKRIGEACHKCMHGQAMPEPKFVFCTFWIEVVHKLHACTAYENEQDSFYQSLNPYVQAAYKKMVNVDYMETLKGRLDPSELKQGIESHKRHVKRTKNAF